MDRALLPGLVFLMSLPLGGCLRTTEFCETAADCAPTQVCSGESFLCVFPVLSVSKTGKGMGRVTSAEGKIDCGPLCSAGYPVGDKIMLSGTPDPGFLLDSFTGCDQDSECQVTIPGPNPAQDKGPTGVMVTATFISSTAPKVTLSVNRQGHFGGTVRSDKGHAGIDCGMACQADFLTGSTVTLHALPDANAAAPGPDGWVGCQPVQGDPASCKVVLNQATAVGVKFGAKPWAVVGSPVKNNLLGVWGAQPDSFFVVGEAATLETRFLVLQWNGKAFAQVTNKLPFYSGTLNPLRSVHGSGTGDVWFAGASQGIIHFDGSSYMQSNGQLFNPRPMALRGVWASGPRDAWAVGEKLALHFDGQGWNPDKGVAAAGVLSAVWGTSAGDVWVAGDGGGVQHYDGTKWQAVPSGTTQNLTGLYAAAGNGSTLVWAAGPLGTVVRYDGQMFSPQMSGTAAQLNAVCGNSPEDVWIAGAGGVLLHCNSQSCLQVPGGTAMDLSGLFCQAPDNVWAVGAGGTILHYGP